MSYDQGYWHTDSCAEQDIPEDNAGTHIAIYVKWCITQCFLLGNSEQDDSDLLAQVRSGALPASDFFENNMGWKFGEWNLNDQGNEFTRCYYGQYLKDLSDNYADALYAAEKSVDFQKVSEMLDGRYFEFKRLGPNNVSWAKKPWWKFW